MEKTVDKKMKNQPGFTLIEVAIAIAVMAIMAAVALPQLSSHPNAAAEREAAEDFVSQLSSAVSQYTTQQGHTPPNGFQDFVLSTPIPQGDTVHTLSTANLGNGTCTISNITISCGGTAFPDMATVTYTWNAGGLISANISQDGTNSSLTGSSGGTAVASAGSTPATTTSSSTGGTSGTSTGSTTPTSTGSTPTTTTSSGTTGGTSTGTSSTPTTTTTGSGSNTTPVASTGGATSTGTGTTTIGGITIPTNLATAGTGATTAAGGSTSSGTAATSGIHNFGTAPTTTTSGQTAIKPVWSF